MLKWNVHYDLRKRPAWYRKGCAQKCLNQLVPALDSFAHGLAQDPTNVQLFNAVLDTAMEIDEIREKLEQVFTQLKSLGLERSPFVLVSVVGQELLAAGHTNEAVGILESGLEIGTTSLKLKQSVLSALSTAYWSLGKTEKAMHYMREDLAVAKSLGDFTGELRANKNLGMAELHIGNNSDALTHYRQMLAAAVKLTDRVQMAAALSSLGQVYMRLFDPANSIASHQQCLEILNTMPQINGHQIAREHAALGNAYFTSGQNELAFESYKNELQVAVDCRDLGEQAKAWLNLANLHQQAKENEIALNHLQTGLKLARQAKDRLCEARICGQLSGLHALLKNETTAKKWAERQLQIALQIDDTILECKACTNLALHYQRCGSMDSCLKLFQRSLELAEAANDKSAIMKAHGNVGVAYLALNRLDVALKHHKIELELAKNSGDSTAECLAHGRLAAVLLKFGRRDQAVIHLQCQLSLASDQNDTISEARALAAMGNYYLDIGRFGDAIPCLDRYLMLAQEVNDMDEERSACHCLAEAYMRQKQFKEAIRYFNQELALAKDLRDHFSMGIIYSGLGRAHAELSEWDDALECHKYSLALAHISKDLQSKFAALQAIGNILLKKGSPTAALKVFGKMLTLAHLSSSKALEGISYGSLGEAYEALGYPDKVLAFFMQQLAVAEELSDLKLQFTARMNIGKFYVSSSKNSLAIKEFEIAADLARANKNFNEEEFEAMRATADCCMRLKLFEEARKRYETLLNLCDDETAKFSLRKELCDCLAKLRRYSEIGRILQKNEGGKVSREELKRLAESCFFSGKFGDALKYAEQMEFSQDDTEFCCTLAKFYAFNERYDDAIAIATDQLTLPSLSLENQCKFWTLLGTLNSKLECFEAAKDSYQQALELAEESGWVEGQMDAYFGLSELCETQKMFEDSRVPLELGWELVENMNDQNMKMKFAIHLARANLLARDFSMCRQWLTVAKPISTMLSENSLKFELSLIDALWNCLKGNVKEAIMSMEEVLTRSRNDFFLEPSLTHFVINLEHVRSFYLLLCIAVGENSKALWVADSMLSLSEKDLQTSLEHWKAVDEPCVLFLKVFGVLSVAMLRLPDGICSHSISLHKPATATVDLGSPLHELIVEMLAATLPALEHDSIFNDGVLDGSNSLCVLSAIGKPEFSQIRKSIKKFLFDRNLKILPRFQPFLIAKTELKHSDGIAAAMDEELAPFFMIENNEKNVSLISEKLNVIPSDFENSEFLMKRISNSSVAHLAVRFVDETAIEISSISPLDLIKDEDVECFEFDQQEKKEKNRIVLSIDEVKRCKFRTVLLTIIVEFDGSETISSREPIPGWVSAFLNAGIHSLIISSNGLVPADSWVEFYQNLLHGANLVEACKSAKMEENVWLYGFNVTLKSFADQLNPQLTNATKLGEGLRKMLETPDECREALRVVLHLIEKSLQRIAAEETKPMYTNESMIRHKIGPECNGWEKVLESFGFEWKESAVYFPLQDRDGKLAEASAMLLQILGLPQTALIALSKLSKNNSTEEDIISQVVLKLKSLVLVEMPANVYVYETAVDAKLWSLIGVPELFASIGYDLLHSSSNGSNVVLKTIRVNLTQKTTSLALCALLAVFEDKLPEDVIRAELNSRSIRLPESDYAKIKTNIESELHRHLPISVQREIDRIRELDLIGSGMESDTGVPGSGGKTKKTGLRYGKRYQKSSSTRPLSGYQSESEMKAPLTAAPGMKGYLSEDEIGRCRSSKFALVDREIIATTAKVIAIEERESPEVSDLEKIGKKSNKSKLKPEPLRLPRGSPVKSSHSQSFVRSPKSPKIPFFPPRSSTAQPSINHTPPNYVRPQQQCPITPPSFYEPQRQPAPRDYVEILPTAIGAENCCENDESSNAEALRHAAKKFVQMQQHRLRSPILSPRFVQPTPPYDGSLRFPAVSSGCINGSPARLHTVVLHHHQNGCIENNNSAAFSSHQHQYAELLPNGSMHNS